jgi:hypothetical protein
MKIKAQVQIKRPLEEVFAYVSNYLNDPVWIGPLVEVQQSPGSPVGMGTTVSGVAHFLGRRLEMNGVVTSYELNRKVCLSSTLPFPQLDCRLCEAVNGDTLFTIMIEAAPGGIFRFFAPVLAFLGRRQMLRDLQALKVELEG